MKLQTAKDIISCLPRGHTPFFYGQDDYSIYLLSEHIRANGGASHVRELKKSPLAALLQKPVIKQIIAKTEQLTPDLLDTYLCEKSPLNLSLTLDTWGCDCGSDCTYSQTSRPGHNLVLQLNWEAPAARKIVRKFNQLLEIDNFCAVGHPARQDIPTVAWIRIDCDFDSGEALIEEIQSDWIRDLRESLSELNDKKENKPTKQKSKKLQRLTKRERYWRNAENYLSKTWSEAALTAAIRFIREDLGMNQIYYHTFDTGCLLKGLAEGYSQPPRSLYTDLPRKFGMQKTHYTPSFLHKSDRYRSAKQKFERIEFYTLAPSSGEVVIGMYFLCSETTFLLLPGNKKPHLVWVIPPSRGGGIPALSFTLSCALAHNLPTTRHSLPDSSQVV